VGVIERAVSIMRGNNQKVVWLHCASLGEFEQGRPIIESLKELLPEIKIVLTFYSPSGYNIRKDYMGAFLTTYLPLDTSKNARRFIQAIKPDLAVFVKYEFWNNYFCELHKNNIPIVSVSTILRPEQVFFKFYGGFFRNILKKVDSFFVQDKQTADLLKDTVAPKVFISGDTRFDRVCQTALNVKPIPEVEKFKGQAKIMVIGSSWPADMERTSGFINIAAKKYGLKFILAPHEISEKGIKQQTRHVELEVVRYSQAKEDNINKADMLIIDNIGMLSSLYSYGDYAYIGGAFGDGLHNTLEAAVFGMPLFFGNKNYKKFREATDLVRLGGAFPVENTETMLAGFEEVLSREQEIRSINKNYVQENSGATTKIVDYCVKLLGDGRNGN